ncbi:MAG: hypothetical protein ACKVP3_27980 [Hyphomicrobiaceae bacterium]
MRIWPFRKQDEPADFWGWFERNRPAIESSVGRLYATANDAAAEIVRDPTMLQLKVQLHRYDSRLSFLIGPIEKGYDLEITAEGDEQAFASVFRLIRAAPQLPNWRFTPLRPHQPDAYPQLDGLDFSSSDFRFETKPSDESPGKFDFLMIANTEHDVLADEERFHHLAFLTLQSHLGEHDFTRYVDSITVRDKAWAEKLGGFETLPLSELQKKFLPLRPN